MMKAILGSALGGLAAGTLALVASAAGRSTAPVDPWTMQDAAPSYLDSPVTYGQSDIVTQPAPRTVQTQSARQVVYRDRPVTTSRQIDTKKRSWQKTALVIGGSTAAGAGVGAIAGGKKGALIGAAVGGGAATIFEAIKRK